ncbi:MAG: lysine--tRNA ligase [Candidatus Uhrbacteria bacterium]|nr:lysine--tRNA ligase [Candidatus Uhrbacteria bacterium]
MTQEEVVRRERLEKMKTQGLDPYPSGSLRTHMLQEVMDNFEPYLANQTSVICDGRVRLIRKHGGLTFVQLQDASRTMQLALHKDQIGEATYEQFHEFVDVGDFLEVTGIVFNTKKGEPTIDVMAFRIMSKALMPLPEKFHGLTDVEARYRERELDLIMNADVRSRFIARSKLVASMRRFLDDQGFMEVETPMLQPIPGGASAKPFITHHNALDADLYLRIAPELYLKRLIVGGFEKIYEVGRCFRNEGIDYAHNPEFTMLELYWAFAETESFITLLENLLMTVIHEAIAPLEDGLKNPDIHFSAPFPRLTFRQAILDACGIDIDLIHTGEAMMMACREKQLSVDFGGCVGMGEYYDALWKNTARPSIIQPTWVFDYPTALKPLTKAKEEDPTKSACMQLVIQGAEVVNAYYNELNNPIDQRNRFLEQQTLREKGSEEAQWMDDAFLSALEHGMPPTSGVGIGIDRLIAFLTNAPNLKEVILFPTLKPKAPETPEV